MLFLLLIALIPLRALALVHAPDALGHAGQGSGNTHLLAETRSTAATDCHGETSLATTTADAAQDHDSTCRIVCDLVTAGALIGDASHTPIRLAASRPHTAIVFPAGITAPPDTPPPRG